MRLGALPSLLLAAAACRPATSPSPDPVSDCGLPESRARACTITLTRALSDTLPCSAYPVYDAANDEFLLRLSVASSNPDRVGGPVSVLVGFRGEPRISAYRSSQRGARSVMYATLPASASSAASGTVALRATF